MDLNARAHRAVEALLSFAFERQVQARPIEGGGRFIDCGIKARGGLLAGLDLARICLGDLADVVIVPGDVGGRPVPMVQVTTDHPVLACLGSQYAGWALSEGKYFAMGSGPMRAAAPDREPFLRELGLVDEAPGAVIGVLEGRTVPSASIVAKIADACGVSPSGVTLLGAPTASLSGGVQVVARSVETALHKLHTLGFDLSRIVAGHGVAPFPRWPEATWRRSAGPTTPSFMEPGSSCSSGGKTPGWLRWWPRSRRSARRTTASHSRRSSPAMGTTSMPLTLTCSARPRCRSRTSTPARPSLRAGSSPTSSAGRSSVDNRRKRLVALVSGLGWHVEDLARAANLVGVGFEPVAFPRVVGRVGFGSGRVEAGGIRLDGGDVDGVLVRMMPPGSLEQVVFRMDALHRLEAVGVPVVNSPRAVEAAVDKYLALARIDGDGHPVPPTWVGESASEALEAFRELGGDVVVKPLFGSEGRGLIRVSDRELALRAFSTLEQLRSVIYLQKYLANPGHDLRVFVLGGEVIGAIARHASAGDWRTNVAVGGRPEPVTLEASQEALAIAAARSVGAVVAGVDLLFDLDRQTWVVLEVNAVPGWKALASTTGLDVAALILAHLRDARG